MIARCPRLFDRLTVLVARLRRDCPWDREQSFETLKTYLLEETYEVLAAVDAGDPGELREELGDLLFQVFFITRLAEERGWFGIDAVADGITRKMTERHPHVFGEAKASTAEEVKTAWEKRKRQLPGATDDPLGTLPAALPPSPRRTVRLCAPPTSASTGRGTRTSSRRSRRRSASGARPAAAGDADAEAHEIGDLLLSLVNLARRRRVDPESALRSANARFRSRFAAVARKARAAGRDVSETAMEELDRYWEEAKKEE
jgi:uncharacterized protein YabN with tetrapyrrole methylase and pyrophosphatase domain